MCIMVHIFCSTMLLGGVCHLCWICLVSVFNMVDGVTFDYQCGWAREINVASLEPVSY